MSDFLELEDGTGLLELEDATGVLVLEDALQEFFEAYLIISPRRRR